MKMKPLLFAAVLVGGLFTSHAEAVLYIYEGFSAGGLTPGAGQYQTTPNSTNGTDNNSLVNQGPATTGFSAGTNWALATATPTAGTTAVAAGIYPQALSTGLNYSDTLNNSLVTSMGSADWHRTSGASATNKRISRATNLTPTLASTGYFSVLMQYTAGLGGRVELFQADGSNGSSRSLFFGFNDAGNLIAGTSVDGGSTNIVTSANTFAADATYLIFGEVVDDAVNDDIRVWLNPIDLSDPTAGVPILTSANIGTGWVANNASFTIRQMRLLAMPDVTGDQVIFDEIRVGSTIGEVLPFNTAPSVAVPEPATASLALLGLGGLMMRRGRMA